MLTQRLHKSLIPKDSFEDDEEEEDNYLNLQHRSKSEQNYENYYLGQHRVASMQENLHDDHDDSSASQESLDGKRDSADHDKGLKRLENNFKFLDGDDDIGAAVSSVPGVHIEKKLDYLFTREVDLNTMYNDASETPITQLTTTKPSSTEPPGINSFFSQDMGKLST